jgi:uncharacterized protein
MLRNRFGLYILIGIFLIIAISAIGYLVHKQKKVYEIKVGIGKKDSESSDLVAALGKILEDQKSNIRLIPVVSKGSSEVPKLLKSGKIDLGFCVTKIAKGAELKMIALMYPQVNHLVVHADSEIKTPSDLIGKTIATSKVGGGTYIALLEILKYYHIPIESVTLKHMSSKKFGKVFSKGEVDAVFHNDPPGDDRIIPCVKGGKGRLLPFDDYDSMRMTNPFLIKYKLPRGLYSPGNPKVPAEELDTVGSYTVFLSHADTKIFIVKKITQILFENKSSLSDKFPLITFLEKPDPKAVFGPSIHQGAKAFYEGKQPTFLQKYSRELSFGFTIFPLVCSIWLALKAKMRVKKASNIVIYHQEIQKALADLIEATDIATIKGIEQALLDTLNRYLVDQTNGNVDSEDEPTFSFAYDKAMNLTMTRISQMESPKAIT